MPGIKPLSYKRVELLIQFGNKIKIKQKQSDLKKTIPSFLGMFRIVMFQRINNNLKFLSPIPVLTILKPTNYLPLFQICYLFYLFGLNQNAMDFFNRFNSYKITLKKNIYSNKSDFF
jgi:hypothetical protein